MIITIIIMIVVIIAIIIIVIIMIIMIPINNHYQDLCLLASDFGRALGTESLTFKATRRRTRG